MGALVSQPFPLRVVSCRVAGLARIWPGASLGLPDHTVLQRDSIYRVQQGEGVHDGADAGVPGVRRRMRGLERALRQAQAQRRSRPVRRFRASCTRDIPVPRGSVARVPVGSLQEIFAPLWAVSAHSFPEMPSGASVSASPPPTTRSQESRSNADSATSAIRRPVSLEVREQPSKTFRVATHRRSPDMRRIGRKPAVGKKKFDGWLRRSGESMQYGGERHAATGTAC